MRQQPPRKRESEAHRRSQSMAQRTWPIDSGMPGTRFGNRRLCSRQPLSWRSGVILQPIRQMLDRLLQARLVWSRALSEEHTHGAALTES